LPPDGGDQRLGSLNHLHGHELLLRIDPEIGTGNPSPATALSIADAEGFQAVSMRRVAQELGVGTMSLYYYVRTKDDLVAVMDDALMGEILVPSLPKGWKRAITEIALRTLAVFLRHPWALVSMSSAPQG
jgi:hypothetical protein